MSRAAQIVAEYTQGRSFAYPHSAEEFLAMAYDELLEAKHRSDRAADDARRQVQSTIHARALELLSGNDLKIEPTIADPTVWVFALEPFRAYTKMLSANPAQWDARLLDKVIDQVRESVAHAISEKLYAMREGARADASSTPQ